MIFSICCSIVNLLVSIKIASFDLIKGEIFLVESKDLSFLTDQLPLDM